jgi:hypothetical protein
VGQNGAGECCLFFFKGFRDSFNHKNENKNIMGRQESRDGNLPAGNVHELPAIYLKMDHMLDCKMHFSFFLLKWTVIQNTVFS